MVDLEKSKFREVGSGTLSLTKERICLEGTIHGESVSIEVPVASIPTLPFGPGKYLEVQQGDAIYRCALEDGRQVMKFINLVKIFHEMSCASETSACR
jgi:hypothetical protein